MIPQWHRGTEWARDAAPRVPRGGRGRRRARRRRVSRRARAPDVGRPRPLVQPRLLPALPGALRRRVRLVDVPRDRGGRYPRYGGTPLRQLAARFAAFARLPRDAGMGRPVVRGAGQDAPRRRRRPPRRARLAQQLVHDDRARGSRHPRARDRRRQRGRADLGRGRVRRDARAFHRGATGSSWAAALGRRPASRASSARPDSSKRSVRASSSSRNRRTSSRPAVAPGHLCGPWPNARCGFGSRSGPNRSGSSNISGVAVRRREHERDPLARADRAAADLDVARRRSGEALVRRVEPQQLLDGRRRRAGSCASAACSPRRRAPGAGRRSRSARSARRAPRSAAAGGCRRRTRRRAALRRTRREQRADDVARRVERSARALGDELPARRVQRLVLPLRRLGVEVLPAPSRTLPCAFSSSARSRGS